MTTGMVPGAKNHVGGQQNGEEAQELLVGTPNPTSGNPWEDTRPGPSRRSQTAPQPLHHRLSYDHASGVIMLPEGESWLDDDEDSDSDEDYGSPSPNTETASPLIDTMVPGGSAGVSGSLPSDAQSPATPSKRRSVYSTYYHHPERRSRQTVPGAFEQGD